MLISYECRSKTRDFFEINFFLKFLKTKSNFPKFEGK